MTAVPPIRVVHLVTTLAIGGLERVVLDLVRRRTQDTFSMHVICLDSSGVLERAFSELGVAVETIGTAGSVPIRILRLARRLRQLKPHVLHTHNPQAHLHGALSARLAKVPLVVHTKHGREYADRRLIAALSRLGSRWTSRFVAVSDDAADVARTLERVPTRKLRVIHNGIDVDRFAVRDARPSRAGARAVTVGRLEPVKDQVTLLRAVRVVVDTNPTFQLDIVGDGPSRPELEAQQNALGLTGHVRFHGYREHVGPFLDASDFFVLSSISEGVSLALLEAMACGLPAVATDVGGNREVVVPGETGYLVPAGSPAALADAMCMLQADATNLDRMGRAARRRVEGAFNLSRVVAQYEGMYLEGLSSQAHATAGATLSLQASEAPHR